MLPDHLTIRSYRRRTCLAVVALCILLWFQVTVAEESHAGAWQIDTYVDLNGSTTYLVENGKGTAVPTLGSELGVELSSPESPIAAGLFADYELDPRSGGEDFWVTGSWARYRYLRWEISAMAAYVDPGSSSGEWMYASALKFRPRSGHKLSLQALGMIGDDSTPAFELAYGLQLSRSVYLTIGVGLGSNRMYDLAANTKLVWSLY